MKRLEKFLRPYRRESILAPLFKLLEVVFDLMQSYKNNIIHINDNGL